MNSALIARIGLFRLEINQNQHCFVAFPDMFIIANLRLWGWVVQQLGLGVYHRGRNT